MTSHETRWNRRELLQHTVAGAALAGLAIVPRHVLGGPGQTPPSEKVNLACIGVGNRGWQVVQGMQHHNIVALCDVDEKYLAESFRTLPERQKVQVTFASCLTGKRITSTPSWSPRRTTSTSPPP